MSSQLEDAIKNQNVELVKSLIAQAANLNLNNDSQQESILHKALDPEKLNYEIIKLLLDSGSKVDAVYADYGCHHSFRETAFQKAMQSCVTTDNGAILSLFLQHGANPSDRSYNTSGGMRSDRSHTFYPIHTAVGGNALSCVRTLLEAKANVEETQQFRGSSEFGDHQSKDESALHIAVSNDYVEMVKLLIDSKANVNRKHTWIRQEYINPNVGHRGEGDPRGHWFKSNIRNIKVTETPLHMALQVKNPTIVSLLLHSRADASIPYEDTTVKSTEELCKEKELPTTLLSLTFSAELFKYNPIPIREVIKTFLLCKERQNWKIPNEVQERIFHFVIATWEV